MAKSMATIITALFLSLSFISTTSSSSSSSSTICRLQQQQPYQLIMNNLQAQSPLFFIPITAIEVDGESLDEALRSYPTDVYAALLFHASWCPFSRDARSTFDILSTMFPLVRHLAIEQSSAMPSVFSRYGIRRLPSILLVNQNQTAKIRYHVRLHGPKDHESLVHFYKKVTGHEPVVYLANNQPSSLVVSENSSLLQLLRGGTSIKEMLRGETYLVLSVLFLCLRAVIYLYPGMLSHIRAVWVHYTPHLNLGLFGETSQLLGRARHVIDIKRVWSKTRNLQKGSQECTGLGIFPGLRVPG